MAQCNATVPSSDPTHHPLQNCSRMTGRMPLWRIERLQKQQQPQNIELNISSMYRQTYCHSIIGCGFIAAFARGFVISACVATGFFVSPLSP